MVPCFDENELVNNLGHLARCGTKAVIEAMSASVYDCTISKSWFIFGLFGFIKDPVVSKRTDDGQYI